MMNNTVVVSGAQNPWELAANPSVRSEYATLVEYIQGNDLPVLAEPGTPLRYLSNAIPRYGLLLPYREHDVATVVVVGHPTLHRSVAKLISDTTINVYIFEPEKASWHEEGKNPGTLITSVRDMDFLVNRKVSGYRGHQAFQWLRKWKKQDLRARRLLQELLISDADGGDYHGLVVSDTIWKALRAKSRADSQLELRLFLGSSSPVRDFDLVMDFSSADDLEKDLFDLSNSPVVYTNRGLAGIDGLVATAHGVALAPAQAPYSRSETVAVLGDVSFLHDAGGLFLGAGEAEPPMTIIVFNDRGGGIFSRLEHGAVSRHGLDYSRMVERYFSTPHDVDFESIARGYGVEYRRIETMRQLSETLLSSSGGRKILEVPIDRKDTHRFYSCVTDKCRDIFSAY